MNQDPLIGQIIGEHFKIIAPLGAGGMAQVFKAEQLGLGRIVAIKILHSSLVQDKDSLARFEREAKVLSSLSHKNIALFYSYGILEPSSFSSLNNYSQPTPYIVMEYLEGKSLRELLNDLGCLPWQRALSIINQVAEAMEHAHNHELIHRDLKPNNILLLDKPSKDFVKVVDFGLAKMTSINGEAAQKLTQTGALVGSVAYMSPEQCQGKPVDAHSDIYSLGCVLYELLTGDPPLLADNPIGLMHKHVHEVPISFSGKLQSITLPQGLEDCVFKALEKDPEKRYQTMKQFREDLELVIQGQGLKTIAMSEGHEGRSRKEGLILRLRKSSKIALISFGVVLALLVAYLLTDQGLNAVSKALLNQAPDASQTSAITSTAEILSGLGRQSAAELLRSNLAEILEQSKADWAKAARLCLDFAQQNDRRGEKGAASSWAKRTITDSLPFIAKSDQMKPQEKQDAIALLNDSADILLRSGAYLDRQTLTDLLQVGQPLDKLMGGVRVNNEQFYRLAYKSIKRLHLTDSVYITSYVIPFANKCVDSGKFSEALDAYKYVSRAMINRPDELAPFLSNGAMYLASEGAPEESKSLLAQVIGMINRHELKDAGVLSATLSVVSATCSCLKLPQEQLKYSLLRYALSRKLADSEAAKAALELSEAYANNGKQREAAAAYEEAQRRTEAFYGKGTIQSLYIKCQHIDQLADVSKIQQAKPLVKQIVKDLQTNPAIVGKELPEIFTIAYRSCRDLGMPEETLYCARGMYRLERSRTQPAPASLIESTTCLGNALVAGDKLHEAISVYEDTLKFAEKNFGNNMETAGIMSSLAELLIKDNNRDRAKSLMDRAIVIVDDNKNADAKKRLNVLQIGKQVYKQLNMPKEYLRCVEHKYSFVQKRYGKHSEKTAAEAIELAIALALNGKTQEFQSIYQDALRSTEARYGKDSIKVAEIKFTAAQGFASARNFKQAKLLIGNSLDKLESSNSSDANIISYLQLAKQIYAQLNMPKEFLSCSQRSYKLICKFYGPDSEEAANETIDRARGLAINGKMQESLAAYQEALKLMEKRHGKNSIQAAYMKYLEARYLLNVGNFKLAEPLAIDSINMMERSESADKPRLLDAMQMAKQIYLQLNVPKEYLRYAERKYLFVQKQDGNGSESATAEAVDLARALALNGKIQEAQAVYQDALKSTETRYGKNSIQATNTKYLEILRLIYIGNPEQAKSQLKDAIDTMERSEFVDNRSRIKTLQLACSIYSQLSMPKEYLRYAERKCELATKEYGPDSAMAAPELIDLARALAFNGKTQEAKSVCQNVLKSTEISCGKNSLEALNIGLNECQLFLEAGKNITAESLLKQVLEKINSNPRIIDGPQWVPILIRANRFCWRLSMINEGLRCAQQVYDLQFKFSVPETAATEAAAMNLASAFAIQGQLKESLANHKIALASIEKRCGKKSLDSANCITAEATYLASRGETEQARLLVKQAMEIIDKSPDKDSDKSVAALSGIIDVLWPLNMCKEALSYAQRKYDVERKLYGQETATRSSAMLMARGFACAGKSQDSLKFYKEFQNLCGPNDFEATSAKIMEAHLLAIANNHADAKSLLKPVLESINDDSQTKDSRWPLVIDRAQTTCTLLNMRKEALGCAQKLYALQHKLANPENEGMEMAAINLAGMLALNGNIRESLVAYQEALKLAQERCGKNSLETANMMRCEAKYLADAKEIKQAQSLISQASETLYKSPITNKVNLLSAITQITEVFDQLKMPKETLASTQRRYDLACKLYGPKTRNAELALHALALVEQKTASAQALQTAKRDWELAGKLYGMNNTETIERKKFYDRLLTQKTRVK